MDPRVILLDLHDAALRAVDGCRGVARALQGFGRERVEVFAIGKAASAMTRGARDALGARLERALVITKDGHTDPALASWPGATVRESAHPLPDARSLDAGEELFQRLCQLADSAYPLFLISGGSSSLVEKLADGVSLQALRELNARGLGAGWDIRRLNQERGRLSRLKHGGIARLLAGRAAHALFISDVPGDDPEVIGSGLLGHGGGQDAVQRHIVANIDAAVKAVMDAAAARGLELERGARRFDADVTVVAREFLQQLRATPGDGLVWGGESTVTLAGPAGRGGRNQHLALLLAREFRRDESLTILAAGTDGTDGSTEDAGAMVDAGTMARAELGGVDVERALRNFDSGLALEAAGDLLHTGPTGTNVGDLLIGLKRSANPVRDLAFARML